jgi:DNA repair protein RAD5
MRQVCDHPLLVVGRGKTDGAQDLKDGPVQLEELMAKFSGDGDQNDTSFGVSVLENLMKNTDEIPECPVCFEDMADGVLMPCMHAACRSCVLDYLQVSILFDMSCQGKEVKVDKYTKSCVTYLLLCS